MALRDRSTKTVYLPDRGMWLCDFAESVESRWPGRGAPTAVCIEKARAVYSIGLLSDSALRDPRRSPLFSSIYCKAFLGNDTLASRRRETNDDVSEPHTQKQHCQERKRLF